MLIEYESGEHFPYGGFTVENGRKIYAALKKRFEPKEEPKHEYSIGDSVVIDQCEADHHRVDHNHQPMDIGTIGVITGKTYSHRESRFIYDVYGMHPHEKRNIVREFYDTELHPYIQGNIEPKKKRVRCPFQKGDKVSYQYHGWYHGEVTATSKSTTDGNSKWNLSIMWTTGTKFETPYLSADELKQKYKHHQPSKRLRTHLSSLMKG